MRENQNFYAKHVRYKKNKEEVKKAYEFRHATLQSKFVLEKDQPVMDLKNVIAILINSNYLQMEALVEECVCYIVSNLHDVVRLPIDMSCLSDQHLMKISERLPLKRLDRIYDK